MTRSYEAEIKAAQRSKKRKLGFVRKDIYIHPSDWPAIYKRIKEMNRRRLGVIDGRQKNI